MIKKKKFVPHIKLIIQHINYICLCCDTLLYLFFSRSPYSSPNRDCWNERVTRQIFVIDLDSWKLRLGRRKEKGAEMNAWRTACMAECWVTENVNWKKKIYLNIRIYVEGVVCASSGKGFGVRRQLIDIEFEIQILKAINRLDSQHFGIWWQVETCECHTK